MDIFLLALIIIAIIAIVIWFSRRSSHQSRPLLHGHTCPACKSDKIRSAGYADRKECAKCGKIF